MLITIAERLRPYSHSPGIACIIPRTTYKVIIFPSLLKIYEICNVRLVKTIEIKVKGPLKQFTVQQDLENDFICVWGHGEEGFVRYKLQYDLKENAIQFYLDKSPKQILQLVIDDKIMTLSEHQSVSLISESVSVESHSTFNCRLSLGNNKAQDWDLIKRRIDMKEILPIWHRLGYLVSPLQNSMDDNSTTLISLCKEAIETKNVLDIVPCFTHLFQAGFEGILTPRMIDSEFQGFEYPPIQSHWNPLHLLIEGSKLIEQIFIQQREKTISILPVLPPEFHSGRLLNLIVQDGVVNMRWSKKVIRNLSFYSHQKQEIQFHFRHVNKCRIRKSTKDRGEVIVCNQPFQFEKNCYYFFDNFS